MRSDVVAVKISDFKAHLAKYLKQVKKGQEVEILDRGTPVARVVPFSLEETTAAIQAPTKRPEDLGKLKSKVTSFTGEVMDILLEERQSR